MAKEYVKKRNTRSNHNNRANQLNPNNDAYWKARGHEKRPSEKNKTPSTRKKSRLIKENS